MAFGAFNPLPLRLGGIPAEGWDYTNHARLAADLAAAKRTAEYAVTTYTPVNGTVTISSWLCRYGNGVGLAGLVTSAGSGSGHTIIQLPPNSVGGLYTDAFGCQAPLTISAVKVTAGKSGTVADVAATFVLTDPTTIDVYTTRLSTGAAIDAPVTVTLWSSALGEWRASASNTQPAGRSAIGISAEIDDYAGALDKLNTETEQVPYAWTFYRELQALRGDALTTRPATFVGAENLSFARSEAARFRAGERLYANALPATSDERLPYWASVFGLAMPDATRANSVRAAAAARYAAGVGPSAVNVDDSVRQLLGRSYVQTWRQAGSDLANPPPQTYWPVIKPGPASYGITVDAAGTPLPWLSERAHVVIEVDRGNRSLVDFLRVINTDLLSLLDRMLPAYCTFDWALTPLAAGFQLDISQLDFHGL